MIKKILLLCVLSLGAFFASAQGIVKGAGIIYTNGAPTHTVNVNTDAETAIDTAAGIWYERSRDGLGWIAAGYRIQKFTGSSAPTLAPVDKESEVKLNDVDSLYRWRGGAWRHVNKVLVYTAGTGISVTGTVIANTGDLSATNEGSLTVLAGTGTTSVIQSNTSGSTNVTITAGTGLSIAETGNTITLTNSSPDQTVTLTNGGGISITGTYPNFTLTASISAAYGTVQEEGTGVTQRSILNFLGSAATAADDGANSRTNVTFDSDVNALASTASTGIYVVTGTGTSATRTITGPAAGITVTNGNGVAGNPTLALANDLSALEALAGTGYAVRTGADTWAQRTFTAGTGISLTNADGVAGNTTITNSSPDQTVSLTNGGGISVTGSYPNFTLTATDPSITNEVLTVSDGTDSEALGGQTLTFVGAGGASADYDPVTNTLTITASGGGGGISNLNGLTAGTQSFATGTSGTDFNISSATSTHTFNLPTASGTNRGALSSADWTTFNNKDGSVTNEGSLTVLAGTGTTSVIQSNTSGSTNVTITAGTGLSISETGNTITLTNSSPDQTVTLTNGGGISITGTYPNFTLTAAVTTAYSTVQEEGTGVTQRSIFNFIGSALTAADDVPNTRTNITVDSDVNALASTASTGLYAITGTGTSATRTITGPAAGITVTNGNGVSGNPTLALADDLAALEALVSSGIAVRTAANTWAQRSVVAGTGAITVTNGDGVSGNITVNNTDPDQLATNEGSLTVGAGGANDSQIQSNTSGSASVTISGTRGITVTESGSTITVGLPTSTTNYGLRFDGTNWASSAEIQNNDTEVGIAGAPITGVELYVNGRGRFDGSIETHGVGIPTGSNFAAALKMVNTTAVTGDTWYIGSLNDGTFALQSGNASTVLSGEADGTIATTYDFKIGDVTGITPTTIIGRDASGYVGTVAIGSGLSLSGGTLSVTGGGGNYQTIQEEGAAVTQRPAFNFIGSAATAADDAPNTRTNITFDSDVNALASIATTGLYAITATGSSATRTITAPAAGITVSNGDGVAGNPTLALANDLAALEGLAGTGYAVRTAANTWAQRTFAAGTGISLTNADGVAGNTTITNSSPDQTVTLTNGGGISVTGTYPNFTLTASITAAYSTVQEEGTGVTQRSNLNFVGSAATAADDAPNSRTNVTFDSDINALASTASTGLYAITGTGTSATRTITGPAAGITVTNGNGVSGNPTLALANDLGALEALAGTGIAVRSAADTWVQRSVVAGTGAITITNGDGVAGNITVNNTDPDQLATNEGSLTVLAGTATTSVIQSNTSGSTNVTLQAGTNITLTETGNTITIDAAGGSSLSEGQGIDITSSLVNLGAPDTTTSLVTSKRYVNISDDAAFIQFNTSRELFDDGSHAAPVLRFINQQSGSATEGAAIGFLEKNGTTLLSESYIFNAASGLNLQSSKDLFSFASGKATTQADSIVLLTVPTQAKIPAVVGISDGGTLKSIKGTTNGDILSWSSGGWVVSSGSGSGLTGTGSANHGAYWTSATNLSFDADFQFDGTNMGLGGAPIAGNRLYSNGKIRADNVIEARGTGIPIGGGGAAFRAFNTTAGTGDQWYFGSMNDGTGVIQSGNANTVLNFQADGTVETIYDLKIDFLNSTPTKVIGVDAAGMVGEVLLGTDVTLSTGELPLWNSTDAGAITSLTATALANVTGLIFNVTAGKEYEFWAAIKYSAAVTTTGSAWSIDCSAGTVQLHVESATANNAQFFHAQNAENTLLASASSAYTTGNLAYVRGIYECTTTGTCQIRGATEVASSAITVQGTSNINWREIK